jgi:hypothetical protein
MGTQEITEIILLLFVTPEISLFYLINMHIENYELGSQYLINYGAIKLYVHLFFCPHKVLDKFLPGGYIYISQVCNTDWQLAGCFNGFVYYGKCLLQSTKSTYKFLIGLS